MTRFPSMVSLGLASWLHGQEAMPATGKMLYSEHSASCHGKHGEGAPDEREDPLNGERALPALASCIDRKMPEDNPDTLDADQYRSGIHHGHIFLSPSTRYNPISPGLRMLLSLSWARTAPTKPPSFAPTRKSKFLQFIVIATEHIEPIIHL